MYVSLFFVFFVSFVFCFLSFASWAVERRNGDGALGGKRGPKPIDLNAYLWNKSRRGKLENPGVQRSHFIDVCYFVFCFLYYFQFFSFFFVWFFSCFYWICFSCFYVASFVYVFLLLLFVLFVCFCVVAFLLTFCILLSLFLCLCLCLWSVFFFFYLFPFFWSLPLDAALLFVLCWSLRRIIAHLIQNAIGVNIKWCQCQCPIKIIWTLNHSINRGWKHETRIPNPNTKQKHIIKLQKMHCATTTTNSTHNSQSTHMATTDITSDNCKKKKTSDTSNTNGDNRNIQQLLTPVIWFKMQLVSHQMVPMPMSNQHHSIVDENTKRESPTQTLNKNK